MIYHSFRCVCKWEWGLWCGFLAGSGNGPGELYILGVGLVLRGATHMDVSSRLAHFGVAIYIAEQAFG